MFFGPAIESYPPGALPLIPEQVPDDDGYMLSLTQCQSVRTIPAPVPMPTFTRETLTIDGTWEGTYYCGGGIIGLTLVISPLNTPDSESNVQAVFSFYAHPDNPKVLSGSFRMKGIYDASSGQLILEGTEWLSRPDQYAVVDLSGVFVPSENTITGQITTPGCGVFTIARK